MLLQAGGWDWNPLIHIPVGAYSVFKDKSMIWNLESEPEPDCHGRRIELPRGKVVGGSLSVNAMVYMRGYTLDYDGWAARHALPSSTGTTSMNPNFFLVSGKRSVKLVTVIKKKRLVVVSTSAEAALARSLDCARAV